ncbi:MAG TPA: helix-turn-helix domain-containing protein [Candidatus Saccharimonadales bacterium]
MLNTNNDIFEQLKTLGLTKPEIKVYIELLSKPSNHLELSRSTGVERAKIYRVVDSLKKRSLVIQQTDDTGKMLIASDPSCLEIGLVEKEEALRDQREALRLVQDNLEHMRNMAPRQFIVKSYDGPEGFKQMLWHQLKNKDDLLVVGSGTVEELVHDNRWSKRYRYAQVDAGYQTAVVTNRKLADCPADGLSLITQAQLYKRRYVSPDIFRFGSQTTVYNDVVAIFHNNGEQKVGLEIVNEEYADMMRQTFKYYWALSL